MTGDRVSRGAPLAPPTTSRAPSGRSARRRSRWSPPLAVAAFAIAAALGCATVTPGTPASGIGARALVVDDPGRARRIEVELFYAAPADARPHAEPHAFVYAPPVARDARLPSGRHPIAVLSHGTGGTPWDLFFLVRALVAADYVVVSVRHPGDTYGDYDVLRALEPWQRPRDVTSVLDAVLAAPELAAVLDDTRVAVIGHSAGGFTALASVGAHYSIANAIAKCTVVVGDPTCDGVRPIDRSSIDYTHAAADYADPRVKAAVALAPAVGEAADPVSAGAITRPVLIVGAVDDELALIDGHARHWARLIPTAVLHERAGGHYQFVGPCAAWGALFTQACRDPAGFDRAAAQADIAADVVAFLGRTL